MDGIQGNLWEFNLAKIVVVDVTDDYRLMQPPLPSEFYPVLKEIWLPVHRLAEKLSGLELVTGYLYDWHEQSITEQGPWYVGVVDACLLNEPMFRTINLVEA
jgi:hypothetical protein